MFAKYEVTQRAHNVETTSIQRWFNVLLYLLFHLLQVTRFLFLCSCYFDGVKGVVANICFTTVPLLLILVMNSILYVLTWKKIREETNQIRDTLGTKPATMRASHRAAKAMSLFVAAFFVQWWAMALYGIWGLAGDVPQVIFHLVTTFSNLGGILNLGVYIIIRRKNLTKGEKISTMDPSPRPSKHSDTYQGSRDVSTVDTDDIHMTSITSHSLRNSNHLKVPDPGINHHHIRVWLTIG